MVEQLRLEFLIVTANSKLPSDTSWGVGRNRLPTTKLKRYLIRFRLFLWEAIDTPRSMLYSSRRLWDVSLSSSDIGIEAAWAACQLT